MRTMCHCYNSLKTLYSVCHTMSVWTSLVPASHWRLLCTCHTCSLLWVQDYYDNVCDLIYTILLQHVSIWWRQSHGMCLATPKVHIASNRVDCIINTDIFCLWYLTARKMYELGTWNVGSRLHWVCCPFRLKMCNILRIKMLQNFRIKILNQKNDLWNVDQYYC